MERDAIPSIGEGDGANSGDLATQFRKFAQHRKRNPDSGKACGECKSFVGGHVHDAESIHFEAVINQHANRSAGGASSGQGKQIGGVQKPGRQDPQAAIFLNNSGLAVTIYFFTNASAVDPLPRMKIKQLFQGLPVPRIQALIKN